MVILFSPSGVYAGAFGTPAAPMCCTTTTPPYEVFACAAGVPGAHVCCPSGYPGYECCYQPSFNQTGYLGYANTNAYCAAHSFINDSSCNPAAGAYSTFCCSCNVAGSGTGTGSDGGATPSVTPTPLPTPTPTPIPPTPTPCPISSPFDATALSPATLSPYCACNTAGMLFNYNTWSCSCPTGYDLVIVAGGTKACRPIATGDFKQYISSDMYPSCGAGRVAVTSFFGVQDISSSGRPKTATPAVTVQNQNYQFAILQAPVGTVPYSYPQYLYNSNSLNRCVCAGTTFPDSPATNLDTGISLSGTRFVSDLYDAISPATPASASYGPVPIAKDGVSSGRDGNYYATGNAPCTCPNFNEIMTPLNPYLSTSAAPGASGVSCGPAIAPDPYLTLQTFNPAVQDPLSGISHILNRASEPKDSLGNLITKITLPTSTGGFSPYTRRIWDCLNPKTLSGTTCIFDPTQHRCDAGSGSEAPSAVSNGVSGTTAAQKFLNTVNKKSACCLNGTYDSQEKYDCVENSTIGTDFNTFWASSDSEADGGNMYAVMLTNATGKVITGFYGPKGYCPQFSEFAGTLQPALVNPAVLKQAESNRTSNSSGISNLGPALPLPTSSGYAYLSSHLVGKSVPTTAVDMQNCPYLFRAAISAICSTGTSTYSVTSGGSVTQKRCGTAANLNVYMRLEQIYKIAGQKDMPPIDSVLDRTKAANISVVRMIAEKYGANCPGTTVRQTDGTCQ